MSKWIWLDNEKFGEYTDSNDRFCLAEFIAEYEVENGAPVTINVTAGARYMLYINDKFIGRGPVSAGLDYFEQSSNIIYYDEYTIEPTEYLKIRAIVTSVPTAMCERGSTEPGFFLELWQNESLIGSADPTWLSRPLTEWINITKVDYTKKALDFAPSQVKEMNQALEKSYIEPLFEERIFPTTLDKITLNNPTGVAVFDKIYSAYPEISIKCDGKVRVSVECTEIDKIGLFKESFVTDKSFIYTSPRMRAIGQMKLNLEPLGATYAEIDEVRIVNSIYPVKNETSFDSSDSLLNKIYDVCMHTLKICRRDLHLDSPTHQEPLACTGDYYIQSHIESLNIYDPTLTAFDILRTARILERNDGEMFHISYSLLFPVWLYNYYQYTGDKSLVYECQNALEKLLKKFESYVGENGLIELAPSYMFVDWILLDENGNNTDPVNMMSHGGFKGFSLHHPPKALGQSVLCMLYYDALIKCTHLYEILLEPESIGECFDKAYALKEAINTNLFDKEKGLYLGGLNTPNEIPSSQWLPENTDSKFYLKQANTLAVLCDIAPRENREKILDYVCENLKKDEMQPYFYFYLLDALIKANMFDKYGFDLIRRYESMIGKCDKGLCEAWEHFPGDCTHAWGGAPAYILKKAISGLEIVEPAFKRIRLNPRLFGLKFADFEISTPYGPIRIKLARDEKTITAPDEIEILEY